MAAASKKSPARPIASEVAPSRRTPIDLTRYGHTVAPHVWTCPRKERAAQCGAFNITIVSRIEVLEGRFASILKAANGVELLRAQGWLVENEAYLSELEVVRFDQAAADFFEKLRESSKVQKWGERICSSPLLPSLSVPLLVTRNVKHFRLVPGLKLENWAD